MTIDRAEVLDVAHLRDAGGVVSIYVDADLPESAGEGPTWAETVQVGLRRICPAERQHELQVEIAQVLDPTVSGRGRALFFGTTGGDAHSFTTQLAIETSVTISETARLQPLLAALNAGRAAGIVVATLAEVRELELTDGAVTELQRRTIAPQRFEWSELKEPNRAHQEDLRRIVRDVGDRIDHLVAERGWDRLVVAGNPRLSRPAAEHMAPRHDVTVVDANSDVGAEEHPAQIAERFRADLELATRRRDGDLLARAEDAALAGGNGAIGVDEVLHAVTAGRAAWVALDRDATLHPHRADRPVTVPDAPRSGVSPDVTGQLIVRALETGTELAVLPGKHYPHLQDAGAIALLRW